MEVAVVTSIYGGFDVPSPVKPQSVDAQWVFVTDDDLVDVPGWTVVVERRPQLHPRLAAKVAKCCPFMFADADYYVWLDGSFEITSPFFLEQLDGAYDSPFSAAKHPWRERLTDEVGASLEFEEKKYGGLPLKEQVDFYLSQGHPDGWGLWECGLLVQSREVAMRVGPAWLAEQVRWSYQDQLSLPYVLRELFLRPYTLPPLREHPHLSMRPHRSSL